MKIVILGSEGFVGKNLSEDLAPYFDCYYATRNINRISKGYFFFDLTKPDSWSTLVELKPDCVINCIGYGVIKTELDLGTMFNINYVFAKEFYVFLSKKLPDVYLLHMGTAFEYDLNVEILHEETPCFPLTHYGISKYLTSHFLLQSGAVEQFTIIRPFSLFGPYEDNSKIVPYLINAQKDNVPVSLSDGSQMRDFMYVKDLSTLISALLSNRELRHVKVINAGRGEPVRLRDIAELMKPLIRNFDSANWRWGIYQQREGENRIFYNGSKKARQSGLKLTDLKLALEQTVKFYENV